MAILTVNFFSNSLSRIVEFQMVLPNDLPPTMKAGNPAYDRKMKTLYLLSGFSGCSRDWLIGSSIQDVALKYNLAVIMPSGENSFYLNGKGTGKAYETYVGEELVKYTRNVFGLSDQKEDTFIGGNSMGGFGAIHTGLAYPETFGKLFALSPALIVYNIEGMKDGSKDEIADYEYYHQVFGDLDNLDDSRNNPEFLVKELKVSGTKIPELFMACGTEDFLLETNRRFHSFLKEQQISNVYYAESAGTHDWNFWNEYLEPAIAWMVDDNNNKKLDSNDAAEV